MLLLLTVGAAHGRRFLLSDGMVSGSAEFMLCNMAPSTSCSMDINVCGHSSICQCPDGYQYDRRIGRCLVRDMSEVPGGSDQDIVIGSAKSRIVDQLPVDGVCARVAEPGPCTADLNTCGYSSSCSCSDGFKYDERAGLCLLATFTTGESVDEHEDFALIDILLDNVAEKAMGNLDEENAAILEQDEVNSSINHKKHLACAAATVPTGMGKCSRDINECGYPTVCQCPPGYQYDARLGPVAGCLLEDGEDADRMTGSLEAALAQAALKFLSVNGNMCAKRVQVGPCTMDLNECDQSSSCACPQGFEYDERIGLCLIASSDDNTQGIHAVSVNEDDDDDVDERAVDQKNEDNDKEDQDEAWTWDGMHANLMGKEKLVCAAAAIPVGVARCSRDVNDCGHPSICQCPNGYRYDARLGPRAGCLLENLEAQEGEAVMSGTAAAIMAETELRNLPLDGSVCIKHVKNAPCSTDLNMCSHSSSCMCPDGYEYDARVSLCLEVLAKGAHS